MSGPGFNQNLSQKQTQNLILAPQLRQSLKILQVAALDLRTVIQEELQNNPALEEMPMEGVSLDQADTGADSDHDPDPDSANNNTPDRDHDNPSHDELGASKDFEILSKLDQDWRDHMSQVGGAQPHTSEDEERRQHFFDSLVSETSLQEHLLRQADLHDLSEPARKAMEHLVGSLDERGFLTQSVNDVALQSGLPLDATQEAAKLLKTLDPAGIGAATLPECLQLQLAAKGRTDSLANRIIRDYFPLLTRRRIPDIARKLGCDLDTVQIAIEEIGTLDPAPGRRFADDNNRVVVPDVTVEKDEDKWVIHLNNDYIPRLRISSTYRDLIAKGTLTKEERDYLRERVRSGKFIINSIDQRQQTIERITREIIKAQNAFFEGGVSQLRPLTMTQIASVVGVHETTVSRALANKFIKTPHGVFEMKYFFTSGYQDESTGNTISNTSVKELIHEIVGTEDGAHPFSDQEIVKILQEKGLSIARRTVAKYREELGLLPSNLRRDYK